MSKIFFATLLLLLLTSTTVADSAEQVAQTSEGQAAASVEPPVFIPDSKEQPTPEQILTYIDDVRAPGGDFIFSVQAELLVKNDMPVNVFDVKVRESKKSLVLYREPVKQRGRALLMDGPDMWIYIPGTSRALRISPQQQLVGGVSHADVARVVFSLDYTAETIELVEEEMEIKEDKNEKGAEKDAGQAQQDAQAQSADKPKTELVKLLKLDLTSKESNTPYRKIMLYCNYSYEPVRAEFYSLSGKLLRTAYYEDYQDILERKRPMAVRMISAVTDTENALLTYSKMEVKETPQAYYQPSYLNQLR